MKTDKESKASKLVRRLRRGKRQMTSLVDKISGQSKPASSGRAGIDLPDALPSGAKKTSYLSDDTESMARARRLVEQEGHRRLARVNAREHKEPDQSPAPEGELQNSIQQHPYLAAQRFDGIDPNLNPEPPLNTDARREFDNERREQEKEKQLKLGNMPKFSTAPKPGPP